MSIEFDVILKIKLECNYDDGLKFPTNFPIFFCQKDFHSVGASILEITFKWTDVTSRFILNLIIECRKIEFSISLHIFWLATHTQTNEHSMTFIPVGFQCLSYYHRVIAYILKQSVQPMGYINFKYITFCKRTILHTIYIL